jgi:hypothetical protein
LKVERHRSWIEIRAKLRDLRGGDGGPGLGSLRASVVGARSMEDPLFLNRKCIARMTNEKDNTNEEVWELGGGVG